MPLRSGAQFLRPGCLGFGWIFQLELGGQADDLREGQLFPFWKLSEGNTYGLFSRCLLTICDWMFSMEFFTSLSFFFITNLVHVYSQYFLTIVRFFSEWWNQKWLGVLPQWLFIPKTVLVGGTECCRTFSCYFFVVVFILKMDSSEKSNFLKSVSISHNLLSLRRGHWEPLIYS